MGTFDVSLPIKQPVVFPPICVVCETANPDSKIELSILGAGSGSMTTLVANEILDMGSAAAVSNNTTNKINGIPACSNCSGQLKRYHRILKIATYTSWIPGLIIVVAAPGPLWLKIVGLLAFVAAPAILSMIFPPAFGATFIGGKANFEFRSKKVANAFKSLNCESSDPEVEAPQTSVIDV